MREVFVLSCPDFPNIPDDFPKTLPKMSEDVPTTFSMTTFECVVIKLSAFWIIFGNIEFNFRYKSCLQEQFLRMCESAWEIVFDAWDRSQKPAVVRLTAHVHNAWELARI